jgi:hypothetical protein
MSDLAITQQDLEAVAALYDQIRAIYKQKNPQLDASLHDAFEKYIKVVMSELAQKVVDQPRAVVDVLVLVTQYKLYQLCAQKICAFVRMFSPDAASVLNELFGKQEGMYTDLAQRLATAGRRAEDLESELKTARMETEEVLQAAETLEKTLAGTQAERDRLREEVGRIKGEYVEQVEQLTEENKLFLDKIIKLSKQNAESAITFQSPKIERKETKAVVPKQISPAQVHPPKDLSLRQLKDFTEELYASKPKQDQKSMEAQQARETMEQHMVRVLNKKYGLKSLVQEWTVNLGNAIQHFASEDSEVAALERILKNEIEEEFASTQRQTKNSIAELLKVYIKSAYPYIQERAMKDMLAEKTTGDLEDEEWDYIVSYMYQGEEADYLKSVLTQILHGKEAQSPRKQKRSKEPYMKPKLAYAEVLKVLLDFQLEGHVKFLSPFADRFKAVDTDKDGIISEAEFKALLAEMGLVEESERLLELVDPFETSLITFSDCVGLFSTVSAKQEQVESGTDKSVSVLTKLHHTGTQPSP